MVIYGAGKVKVYFGKSSIENRKQIGANVFL
jgi:hypothetical protein